MRLLAIIATGIAIPLSFIGADYPNELVLQHVPTVAGVAMLVIAVVRFHPSSLSLGCCIAFLWLHLIGARWIYSYVPYDEAMQFLTGHTLSDLFDWRRNHYDRLVHFASGCLGVPPLSEFLQVFCRATPLAGACLAVVCVLAIGAAYEVIEWQIAMTFSPAMAESYNGQQGDIWDAQKDLALAWIGAMIALPFFYRWEPSSISNSAISMQ
ncbi:hypothetical protein RSSM_00685 [Rhodopirellula sallentina SM41]|uniref:Uncharacterized protein n=2 Tax=Rhodopirellula TaxID=265488 RepID=M5UJ55_9BACT|nr:hypothetical protein RSSM_00685 [Rhodopirellula sallentina SM41]